MPGEKKYRLSFTEEELQVLADRLEVVSPSQYSLRTYTILRDLYGRFTSILIRLMPICKKGGKA